MNRIKQLRNFFGYTQDRLAKLLKVSRSTVAMWETSPQNPDYETLRTLSQIFNVSPDFVMGTGIFSKWDQIIQHYDAVVSELKRLIPGTLDMPSFCEDKSLIAWLDTRLYFEPDEIQLSRWFAFAVSDLVIDSDDDKDTSEDDIYCMPPQIDVTITFTPEFNALIRAETNALSAPTKYTRSVVSITSSTIPVLGDVAAGIPIEAVQDIVDYEEIDAAMAATGEFFGLRLKGSSMEPRMREDDVVIVRKQSDAESGDTVVVMVNGDSATVKKIKKGPSGITLIPNNPAYDPMFYSNDEIAALPVRILGKVVELRAKF